MADHNDGILRRVRVYVLACLFLAILSGADSVARAALLAAPPFTVNSTADIQADPADTNYNVCRTAANNNICTLRAAIMKANHRPDGATIVLPALSPGLTYKLQIPPAGADGEASGDLNISTTVTLLGGGASHTIIDGNGGILNDRVFKIEAGAVVRLTGVTIQKGNLNKDGGGLYNLGRLTLDSAVVFSNTSTSPFLGGGGIYSVGPMTITNSVISSNLTSGGNDYGGGIVVSAGSLTLANSTVINNQAGASGGGIENDAALTITSSTLAGNTAGQTGGGLNNSGPALLIDSTVRNNRAGQGGGLFNIAATVALVNSTVSGNLATTDGGGIENSCGCTTVVNLFNTTVAANRADSDLNGSGTGGGIYNFAGAGNVVHIQNSLIADNLTGLFVFNDCHGTLASIDYNLVSNTTGGCTVSGGTHDHTGLAAYLGPLQNNGGPTLTQALLPGSPAIDAGNPGGCMDQLGATLTTDQRGAYRRAFGGHSFHCDIGAFELQQLAYLPLVSK